ncbi:hypothetical protein JF546_09860 [Nitratireductor aquimarinus]|uniref:hypothetical protein n=1 Tax=Nitratireductor aquimarinus TaxID=889300 RepID=UPI001A8FDCC5|nr:hypothetical protein [Nitratireductor aquimarinus]MBN8243315.1 hypothetical protein [Nitratireductor aquimarinus]MBY6131216.1 hypothetical protein [Nitratireductor aquimarinus]MCA1302028.1 hypothetical protein [Nitratireductor aquimarinus]
MSDTANYNWPKPRTPGASQIVEIQRVATALDQADAKAKEISDALAALNAAYDAHTHAFGDLTGKPSTVAGFGITDAYTKSEINTKVANDIDAAINALINGSPGALDTLQELATAMGNDPNFAATVTNSLATKVTKSLNLSDIPDKSAARGNLGLGSAATASVSSFATAAQGGKADTAVQPGNLGSAAFAAASSFLGAGAKAVDADKVDGYHASAGANANTVAVRNGSGYLYATIFNQTYASTNSSIHRILTQNSSDGFLRPSTPDQVNSVLPGTAKAWVNFNGTGSVAIRDSFNVSSITDLGTGKYRINFASAMPNANYAVCGSSGGDVATYGNLKTEAQYTSRVEVGTHSSQGADKDLPLVSVIIMGD